MGNGKWEGTPTGEQEESSTQKKEEEQKHFIIYVSVCIYTYTHTHKQFGLTMLSTRLMGYLTKSPVPSMGKLLSSR